VWKVSLGKSVHHLNFLSLPLSGNSPLIGQSPSPSPNDFVDLVVFTSYAIVVAVKPMRVAWVSIKYPLRFLGHFNVP
jgi:hypothetical protein